MRASGRSLIAATLVVVPACECGRDRPYTPFQIEPPTSGASPSTPSAIPSASAGPAGFEPRESVPAPKDTSEWTLDGVSMGVDKSKVIDRAVVADLDGDGALDAVAWTRPRAAPPDSHGTGELLFFSMQGAAAGRVVATTPPFVPAGPGCVHTVRLSATGPHTVTFDVRAHCDAALLPRSPTRGVAILAPAAARAPVLVLRVADAAPDEKMDLAVDSRDRDGDGRDDVRVSMTLRGAADDREVAADFVWLDRTAGPSRDAAEPARSFGVIAALEGVRAPGKNTGRAVPGRVANARRLYAALCAESGTPRLFDADGAPLPCGDASAPLGQLTAAEIRALVGQRDAVGAAAAISRATWYSPPLPEKARVALEKSVLEIAPGRSVQERALDQAPRARAGLPRFSPLAFENDGSLLIQTVDGIVRAKLPDLTVDDTGESIDPWPLLVGGGALPHWTGVSFPCDRSEALLLESSPEGSPLAPRPTRLLAPRPGPCRPGGTSPDVSLVPIEWTSTRRAGMIGGALFGASALSELGAVVRGSPRSPDGKAFVSPWARGLLVARGGNFETWLASDPLALSDCVVANDLAAACIRGGRAVVLLPLPPLRREEATGGP